MANRSTARVAMIAALLFVITTLLTTVHYASPASAQASGPDYAFLNTLKLPWACGETMNLSGDWEDHRSTGFALDLVETTPHGERGRVNVLSPISGKVIKNADAGAGDYGHYIQIEAENKWSVLLAHLNAPSPLAVNTTVRAGDVVGVIGRSGTDSIHIHVEILYNKTSFDFDKITQIFGRPRDDFKYARPYKGLVSNNCRDTTIAEGFVRDHRTGAAVSGADVELRTAFGTLTRKSDASGYFVFTGAQPGPAKLIARKRDVGEGSADISIVFRASQVPAHIRLLPFCIDSSDPRGAAPRAGPAQTAAPCPEGTGPIAQGNDFALMIDSSGSMYSTDPNRLRVAAAKLFVQTLEDQDRVTIIDFDDRSRVLWPLQSIGSSRTQASSALDSINALGGTNISGGIAAAFAQLNDGSARRKIGILLTDGRQEGSPYDPRWQSEFAQRGWPIYTFALSGAADEALLRSIARETKGESTALSNAEQLVALYNKLRIALNNTQLLASSTVTMRQGESRSFAVRVPQYARSATFITSWPGSQVDTHLEAPDGTIISATTVSPDITHTKEGTFEVYRVRYPLAGVWRAHTRGVQLAPAGEAVTFQADAALALRPAFLPSLSTTGRTTAPSSAGPPAGELRILGEKPLSAGGSATLQIRLESGEPSIWTIEPVVATCAIAGLPTTTVSPEQRVFTLEQPIRVSSAATTCTISTVARTKGSGGQDVVLPLTYSFEVLPSGPVAPAPTATPSPTPEPTSTPAVTPIPTATALPRPGPTGALALAGDGGVFAATQRTLEIQLTASEPTQWTISALRSNCALGGLPAAQTTDPLTQATLRAEISIPEEAGRQVCTVSGDVSTRGTSYPQTTFPIQLTFDVIARQLIAIPPPLASNISSIDLVGGCVELRGYFDDAEQALELCESTFLLPSQWNDRAREIVALCSPSSGPITVQLWEHIDFDGASWRHTFCTPGGGAPTEYIELRISADSMDGFEDGSFRISGDGNGNNWVGVDPAVLSGFVFDNVPIPRNATILNAQLRLRGFGNGGGATPRIRGFAQDNAQPFSSDGASRPGNRGVTASYVDWARAWAFEWQWFHSPDLAPVIAEVTQRSGWSPGNNLGLRITNPSGSGTNWSSVDFAAGTYQPGSGGPGHRTTLLIAYRAP